MGLGLDLIPIVQALAAKEPTATDREDRLYCTLCGAEAAGGSIFEQKLEHDPACPWRMAKEELEPMAKAIGDAAECGSCRAPIRWIITKAGKRSPMQPKRLTVTTAEGVTVSGYESHFAYCPRARDHRR